MTFALAFKAFVLIVAIISGLGVGMAIAIGVILSVVTYLDKRM